MSGVDVGWRPDDIRPARFDRFSAPSLIAKLRERAAKPAVCVRIDDTEIARIPVGNCFVLIASTGDGKTSLAAQLAWQHALNTGPAVYLSFELSDTEVLARIVAQRNRSRWLDVIQYAPASELERGAADLERLRIIDSSEDPLEKLAPCVEELQARYPGQPVFIVVDYLQIADDDYDQEARRRITAVAEKIRQETQRLNAVTLELSQTSRTGETALRTGKAKGIETVGFGAESGQIERAAVATFALGQKRALDDEWSEIVLSRGKSRFETPDCTLRLEFNGATGQFRVATGAKWTPVQRRKRDGALHDTPATDDLAELQDVRDKAVTTARLYPGLTKTKLAKAMGGNYHEALKAIEMELGPTGRLKRTGKQRGAPIVAR